MAAAWHNAWLGFVRVRVRVRIRVRVRGRFTPTLRLFHPNPTPYLAVGTVVDIEGNVARKEPRAAQHLVRVRLRVTVRVR